MLGRSARRDPSNGCRGATNRRAACGNGKTPNCHRPKAAKRRSTTIRRRRTTSLPSHGRGGPQQARIAIANRNAAEDAEQWFLLQLPVHRAALLSRAGRSLGRRRPANIRLSPGVPRRLRPNLKPYFVILSGAKNLFWARLQMFRCAQHDGCSGSSQRSERQTKCSQISVC